MVYYTLRTPVFVSVWQIRPAAGEARAAPNLGQPRRKRAKECVSMLFHLETARSSILLQRNNIKEMSRFLDKKKHSKKVET